MEKTKFSEVSPDAKPKELLYLFFRDLIRKSLESNNVEEVRILTPLIVEIYPYVK